MAIVKITELAEADLDAIWDYLSENNVQVAKDFLAELTQKFDFLADNPLLGKGRFDFILNLRSFPHKKYLIFYFPIENGVEIYRVLHSSRSIDAIFTDFFEGLDE